MSVYVKDRPQGIKPPARRPQFPPNLSVREGGQPFETTYTLDCAYCGITIRALLADFNAHQDVCRTRTPDEREAAKSKGHYQIGSYGWA